MTLAAYKLIGQLQGAISKYADKVLEDLRQEEGADFEHKLGTIFTQLVTVDADKAIRKRAPLASLRDAKQLVDKLIHSHLLCAHADRNNIDLVELAQDALLDRWPTLKSWIDANRVDLLLWEQLAVDADRWLHASASDRAAFLWRGHRLKAARELLKRWRYAGRSDTANIQKFIKSSYLRQWRGILLLGSSGIAVSVFLIIVLLRFVEPSLVRTGTTPVGVFDANGFGLCDVLGNVWEWTNECGKLSDKDSRTTFCRARGGSWDNHESWYVRPDYWMYFEKNLNVAAIGFRIVRDVSSEELRDVSSKKPIQDCPECPEMVIVPEGDLQVRSRPTKNDEPWQELPAIGEKKHINPFAIGVYEVTVAKWSAFCRESEAAKRDEGLRRKCEGEELKRSLQNRPITNVSWEDAQEYTDWLSKNTEKKMGKKYRLPTRVGICSKSQDGNSPSMGRRHRFRPSELQGLRLGMEAIFRCARITPLVVS